MPLPWRMTSTSIAGATVTMLCTMLGCGARGAAAPGSGSDASATGSDGGRASGDSGTSAEGGSDADGGSTGGSSDAGGSGADGGSAGPLFNLWWHDNTTTGPLHTFLQSQHPGVSVLALGSVVSPQAGAVKAGGYGIMEGLGGYAAQWAQGYPQAADTADIEKTIDTVVSEGATWIFVNEPWQAPGETTAKSPASIRYNVTGFNILYDYIHTKYEGVQFGLTIGDDGGAPLHLAMLNAGLHEDFSAVEYYNACCSHDGPFAAQKAAFPNVKTMILTYGTETLCQRNAPQTGTWLPANGVDIWGFWDVDLYGGWIGPLMDASFLQNAETFAQTGKVDSFCTLPASRVDPAHWTWAAQTANFTVPIKDASYWPSTDTVQTCQWKVMSGPGGINGPTDPSMTVTLDWTARPCNGNITVTVGATGSCRDNGLKTCLVFTRALTASGAVGNVTYQEYSISY